MRRLRLALVGLLALAVRPAPLRAQSIPSPYEYVERAQSVRLFAGYLSTDPGLYGLTPHSGPVFGARYEGRFTGPISGVVELSAMPSRRDVYSRVGSDPKAPLTPLGDAGVLVMSAEGGFRLSLAGPRTWHALQPFVTVTAGATRDFGSRIEEESVLPANQIVPFGLAFAVGPSAGIDWFVTDRFSLRIQAKDHLWRRSVPEGLSSTGNKQTDWTHNLGVTIGTALHF
jgi:hypothetical protein